MDVGDTEEKDEEEVNFWDKAWFQELICVCSFGFKAEAR